MKENPIERIKLKKDLYPVEVFFNGISDTRFPDILYELSAGFGYDIDYVECSLPKGIAEESGGKPEDYNYVQFIAGDDSEAKISFLDFLNYTITASNAQMKRRPEQRAPIIAALKQLKHELKHTP